MMLKTRFIKLLKECKESGVLNIISAGVIIIVVLIVIDNIVYKEKKIQDAQLVKIEKCDSYKRDNIHPYKVYYLYKFITEDDNNITLMINRNKPELVSKLEQGHIYTVVYRGKTDVTNDIYPEILRIEE